LSEGQRRERARQREKRKRRENEKRTRKALPSILSRPFALIAESTKNFLTSVAETTSLPPRSLRAESVIPESSEKTELEGEDGLFRFVLRREGP